MPAFLGGDINVWSKKSPCRAKHGRNAFSQQHDYSCVTPNITDKIT